jgi:quercetin dioxygenase-like cupin family protein
MGEPVVVRLGELMGECAVGDGVQWGIETRDLDVNLVHLDPLSRVETHLNLEVDVVILGLEGTGWIWLGADEHRLDPQVLAVAPRGITRSIAAGRDGLTYVTLHRRRRPLSSGLVSTGRDAADVRKEVPTRRRRRGSG